MKDLISIWIFTGGYYLISIWYEPNLILMALGYTLGFAIAALAESIFEKIKEASK